MVPDGDVVYCYRIDPAGGGALYGIGPNQGCVRSASPSPAADWPLLFLQVSEKSGEAYLVDAAFLSHLIIDCDDGDAEYIPDTDLMSMCPSQTEQDGDEIRGGETLRTCLCLILALLQYTFYRCVLRATTMYYRVPESVQLEIQSGESSRDTGKYTEIYIVLHKTRMHAILLSHSRHNG